MPERLTALGGGMSPRLRRGRLSGLAESRHLVLRRIMRSKADADNRAFIDVGSDVSYPFYDDYGPTRSALAAVAESARTVRAYPSSYGIPESRESVAALVRRQFGVRLNPSGEMVITAGATQAFDALSRSYAGAYVLVPRLTLSTVEGVSIGNGATVRRIPLDRNRRIDLGALEREIEAHTGAGIRFLYINSPASPTGVVYPASTWRRWVGIVAPHRTLLVHDHDSWFTTHTGRRSVNILEIPGAMDIAVTVLSVSKELGPPGLRIAAVAGCPEVVNVLRIHNPHFGVMLPEPCQRAAAVALRAFRDDEMRRRVQREIAESLRIAVRGQASRCSGSSAVSTPCSRSAPPCRCRRDRDRLDERSRVRARQRASVRAPAPRAGTTRPPSCRPAQAQPRCSRHRTRQESAAVSA